MPTAADTTPEVVAFSAATAVTPGDPGTFTADVHPEWTIGGRPNGGYLLAALARAAVAVAPHADVIAASAHYLHSPGPGAVQLEAEVLRAGRSASQVRARMSQDGTPCVETLFLVGALDPAAEPYWDAGLPAAPTTDFADAIRLPATNPAGLAVPIMGQADVRIDRDSLGWGRGRPSGRGELRGWIELPHGEAFDPISLLYAVDAFPPATFDIEMTGWVPTLELTSYIRAIPAPGPLRMVQRAHLVDQQRVDEVCWVWDSRGRVVAQATQLAGIRLG
ncbi:MAG TPA: thioesterase family protein [Jatrophihabitans sp.]|uniref:thioesterase family protein n=1 Tax=Jatrophihabitans sp. TaxID=1932789 RepID=UPI002E0572C8|nr:thioesterase family protein [Jatrophihabitans sp.]